jgi:type VI secretion system protein ImpH
MRRLAAQAEVYDFFLAARMLECARRDLPRLGYSLLPGQDPVRFSQEAELAFPASTIKGFDYSPELPVPRLAVRFFGLFGPNGPMPLHFTEYARERKLHHKDLAISAFADMFHHRLISFFYRAWAANEPTVSFDRHQPSDSTSGDEDHFATYFASLFGLGTKELLDRDSLPTTAKLFFAGRLLGSVRNPEGLRAILADYFSVAAEIQEFCGRWISLPDDSVCRLGADPDSCRLGQTMVLGGRVWDVQGKFRIVLGPMPFSRFEHLLPGSDGFQNLCHWVRLYLNDEFEWDVKLVLEAAAVPGTMLGQSGRLGYTTWLHTQPMTHDVHDLICRPVAA